MPYYEELVTRTRRIAALGRVQEKEIILDVLEGGRFQDIVQELKSDVGEPWVHVSIDMLDGDKPMSVMFYGKEACETVKRLPHDERIAVAGEKENATLKAWELYVADKDPLKDKLLWAHPEIRESIDGPK